MALNNIFSNFVNFGTL